MAPDLSHRAHSVKAGQVAHVRLSMSSPARGRALCFVDAPSTTRQTKTSLWLAGFRMRVCVFLGAWQTETVDRLLGPGSRRQRVSTAQESGYLVAAPKSRSRAR